MTNGVSPHFVHLVYDALLKSFWRKSALRKFLRQCKISDTFLSTWAADESKRSFLDRLFDKLQSSQQGPGAIRKMADYLAEQQTFPDLQNWEDSAVKIREAHLALDRLRAHLGAEREKEEQRVSREETQRRFRERQAEMSRSRQDLVSLKGQSADQTKGRDTPRHAAEDPSTGGGLLRRRERACLELSLYRSSGRLAGEG